MRHITLSKNLQHNVHPSIWNNSPTFALIFMYDKEKKPHLRSVQLCHILKPFPLICKNFTDFHCVVLTKSNCNESVVYLANSFYLSMFMSTYKDALVIKYYSQSARFSLLGYKYTKTL